MKFDQNSWDAGFRVGFYGEPFGNHYGYHIQSFTRGYGEGIAKRQGKPSQYDIDPAGNVNINVKFLVN